MTDAVDWKIVLIDDEPGIRKVMGITLADAGYQVMAAENGYVGLRLCRETPPQIVITDIKMPGMDGLAVLESLKQTHPETEVIVITAFGDIDMAIRALQLDASDFVTKPVNDDALHMALQRARERYTARRKIRDYTALLEKQNARTARELHRAEADIEDQARILHQDKMMSLGRLAASVVHEINNPLAGILNYIRLMLRITEGGSLTAEQTARFRDHLDLMESETRRCSEIVSSLLTFSRRSTPLHSEIHVEELLNRCILLSRHKLTICGIRLKTEIATDLPTITGDFNQLQQCVINLVFNAIDAMPDGGDLFLAARYDPAEKQVVISVKDSGKGIPPEDLPRIFEPFFTTKKEGYGVGLGLSILYGMVESNNGRIHVDSRPGQGTTFVLEFDVPDKAPA